jgi:hypothetical protein
MDGRLGGADQRTADRHKTILKNNISYQKQKMAKATQNKTM